ncbi:hypothetical protein LAZ67_5003753 [Cordylochernes scorpioides]|uniref:Uncharacterized protein n=1 Tax=Cordylochernes scorpioides TaxID=51811 RepID=A0ABY6KHI8_9ARAC|nr:hypothetical protein LAZ67_5003753 [Cordylochernes scorpioides]
MFFNPLRVKVVPYETEASTANHNPSFFLSLADSKTKKMSEDCLSRIKVFNGENFSLWKFQFRLLLEQQKLLELLEGLEIKPNVVSSDSNSESSLQNWKSKDVKARMLLSQAIELKFLQPLMNCTSASQMWQKLLAIHEQKSEFTIGLLWQQFFDARLTSETISDYIAKIENISAQISQMGGTITEDQKVAKILNTLPSSMRYFVAAWESLDPKAQTLNNLTARLLIEEKGINKAVLLNKMRPYYTGKHELSLKIHNKNTKCHYCHKIGHWSRECRKRLANEKNKSKNLHDSKGSSSDYGLILCDNQVEPNDIWYADSGASCSMTFRREWFKTYTPFTSDHPIYLGDNSTLLAEGMGDIEIQAYVDGGWYNTYIRNVLYSPQLKKNLYSLSTSTRRGFNVIIKHDKLQIFMDNDLKAVGVRHDGLYRMLFKVTSSSQGYITSENKLQLWHERLAHLPVATLREMATKGLVDGLQPQDLEGVFFFCEGCQLGKAHRKSCNPSDGKNYQLGEFIYADICGPMQTQSLSKYLYFCLFKDYFSGYRHIYFIKNKSDVLDIFKEYATLIYTQTGNKIKVFRTDNALEFKSDNFADLCKRFGIIHEFTAPYVHEQIGRIERDNRTIVEAARIFWAEACNTATNILNRSATKQTPGTTPYELFFGTKPNVANYKIFGCNAYMHIPKENRKKWDNKSIKLMFLGYENTSKNFRLWDWKTRKIRISKDVTFDEKATPDRESTKPKEIIFQINSAPDESPVETANIPVQEMPPVSDISSHPMITRSKVLNSQCNFALADEPSNYIDAITSTDSERWKLAMDEEIDALNKNKTWTLERLADGHKPIGCKWVYKIKTESDGTIQRFKARLVAKGYSQIKNVVFFDTFSPVVRYDSLRILLSHAASERMFLKQFDVKTAFLNGELEKLVYLEQPEGYKRDDNSCYRLHKSLYGLKQSSRNWNKKFTNFLNSHNFKTSDADPCIFIGTHNDSNVILALYVDDGIILSKDKEAIAIIMDELEHAFEITSGSVNFFVGLQIEQSEDRASIFIHQSSYIDKILSKFNMADCIPASVPMDPSVILTKQDCPTPEQKEKMPKFPFREAVGSLMFASCVSRPDITYAVSQVSKFLEYPGPAHCTTVKNIFRYLKGTPHMGILFTGQDQLVGYSDSDFARDVDSRKSTTGYAFMMNGGTVSWASQRQPIIALSTTESEYIAACELIWIRRLLQGIGCDITKETELYIDNQAALKLVETPVFHKRTKHIDVRYHFIRSKHEEGELKVHHVCSSEQLPDIMTKPLPRNQFHYLRGLLNILDREGASTANHNPSFFLSLADSKTKKMSEDCLSRIKVFNGENFSLWKFQFRLLLEQQKLLELLEGLEIKPNVVSSDSNSESSLQNWKSKDVKARMLLSQAIELKFLQPLMNCTSASQMWQKLLAIHEQKSEFTIGLLWQQFFDARLTSETISDYIAKIENISAQISQMGGTITEDQKVAKILNTLPSSMRYFVAAWESLDPKAQTLNNLTARLLIEETRNQQSGSSKQDEALLHRQARTKPKDTQRSFQDAKKNTKCHYCHKIGHWSRECRKRLANEKNKSKNLHDSKGSSSDYGLILCDNQVEPNDIWYADSGASCSMTFRREWFKTYTPFTSDHPIYLGDNSTLLAEGMGDIEIQAYVDGGWYNTYIRNVLYSPQLKKNLYSLSTSTRRGFNVIIKHDKLQIFMDNDLKAVGVRHDGLYRMLFKVTSSSQGYITSENKLQLWHERLAHLPVATLREMATKGLVDGLQPQDLEGVFFFCEGCQLGKAHRKSCNPSDGKNYQLGEFIYADICGPMQTQSLSKYLYFCLFKDYFSGYRHIYFIKNKSDVLDIFKEYATLIYTQTGNKIKVFRTDNALEFKSDNFADLCKRFGIIHEFTAPYVHEQIGRIERDNRTIVEAARSMLNSRNLPGFFGLRHVTQPLIF